MKWSPTLHGISAISGITGALALIGAWIAGTETFLGFSQGHLYNDAMGLLLVSIAFGLGTLMHMWLEKEGRAI